MKRLSERFEMLSRTWLQNELFEQTRDYLARGRRFERLRVDQLNEEWAKAFQQFVKRSIGPYVRDMDDAGAELRIRGAEFPTHLVTSEVEQLRAAVRRICSITPTAEFDRKIEDFASDLHKPMG